jgi:hypothetical protein
MINILTTTKNTTAVKFYHVQLEDLFNLFYNKDRGSNRHVKMMLVSHVVWP